MLSDCQKAKNKSIDCHCNGNKEKPLFFRDLIQFLCAYGTYGMSRTKKKAWNDYNSRFMVSISPHSSQQRENHGTGDLTAVLDIIGSLGFII